MASEVETHNHRLKAVLEIQLDKLKKKGLIKNFAVLEDGTFLLRPNLAVEPPPELTIEVLTAHQAEFGNLTVAMVEWAMAEINHPTSPELREKCLYILDRAFRASSPMWRQSHHYLREFLEKNGVL